MEAYEQTGGPRVRPPAPDHLDPPAIERLAAPVPRYTSYPTAPHFHAGVTSETYRRWLSALPDEASLSLYLHIPFCDTLCWFCGCATKIVRRYEPIAAYLKTLRAEMTEVGAALPGSARVSAVHWGGGSPSILSAGDIVRLMDWTRERFAFASEAEFAIEIDPRGLDIERIDALAASGVTRVSIGVQDFDPSVQAAINRMQSVEETRAAIDAFGTGASAPSTSMRSTAFPARDCANCSRASGKSCACGRTGSRFSATRMCPGCGRTRR